MSPLKLYDGQSRVAIITFSGEARVERYLKEPASKDDIFAAIDTLIYDGHYPFQVGGECVFVCVCVCVFVCVCVGVCAMLYYRPSADMVI